MTNGRDQSRGKLKTYFIAPELRPLAIRSWIATVRSALGMMATVTGAPVEIAGGDEAYDVDEKDLCLVAGEHHQDQEFVPGEKGDENRGGGDRQQHVDDDRKPPGAVDGGAFLALTRMQGLKLCSHFPTKEEGPEARRVRIIDMVLVPEPAYSGR